MMPGARVVHRRLPVSSATLLTAIYSLLPSCIIPLEKESYLWVSVSVISVMANHCAKRLIHNLNFSRTFLKRQEFPSWFSWDLNVFLQRSRTDKADSDIEAKDAPQVPLRSLVEKKDDRASRVGKYSTDNDLADNKWRLELAWLTKARETALQIFRWALPTGDGVGNKVPPASRSLLEILASIQGSKIGIQDWSLSDLTVGLYLIYLRQASTNPFEDIKVQDLIYHIELAKGACKDSASVLARHSMLRECNVLKFVRNSSVMRPGYYIGVDPRRKLIILGIRGTHTVYDLITDIVTSSDGEVTFEGYSIHFGTAEAARWFLFHQIGTIKQYLDIYQGFRLRLVGHSLGGAIASLLAIMIRRKSAQELGLSPDIVSAIGYGTPPFVSKDLAESCSEYVNIVVMQDDIIPRLSVASLTRLRNEILQTDWMSVVEKEDWKSILDLVTNARQVVTSVQDVAWKLVDYANFRRNKNSEVPIGKESPIVSVPLPSKSVGNDVMNNKTAGASITVSELFIPGAVYHLRRNSGTPSGNGKELFTLWKRHPSEHFQRIILSSNLISDHKCDSHYYALRDVLKVLPWSGDGDSLFNCKSLNGIEINQ